MPPGTAVGPVSGYPQGGYQPGPYQPGGPYGPPPGSRRGKTIGLSVLALVVVGALVAVLIVVLGGDDDKKGVAAEGTVTDRTTGVSIPRLKGWVVRDSDEPADQYFTRPCPSGGPSSGATSDSDSDSSSSDSPDSSDSSDSSTDTCLRAGVAVVTESADTFDELIGDLKKDIVKESSKVTVTATELDKRVSVDGHPGYVLRVKVRGTPKELEMDSDTAWAQIVAIDAKNADGEYPCVVIKLENSGKAPDKSVLDVVLKGIKVGTPTPTESAS
jgi:hypothetical protein